MRLLPKGASGRSWLEPMPDICAVLSQPSLQWTSTLAPSTAMAVTMATTESRMARMWDSHPLLWSVLSHCAVCARGEWMPVTACGLHPVGNGDETRRPHYNLSP
jgi:hypothetical protein